MNKLAIALAVVGLGLSACQRDKMDKTITQHSNQLSLQTPKVGQQSRYIRFSLAPNDTTATYYKDTLLLSVKTVEGSVLLVTEQLSEHSNARFTSQAVAYPDRVFEYQLSLVNDNLEVESNGGKKLQARLFPSFEEKSCVVKGYKLGDQSLEMEGERVVTEYLPVNRSFSVKNKQPTQSAYLQHEKRDEKMPGFTFVFDKEHGIKSTMIDHDLYGNVSGWKLIQ